MTCEELMREWYSSVDVDAGFFEARVVLHDRSLLEFCHRVDQRWAKAIGPEEVAHQAGQILAQMQRFRLNAKHLDIHFTDGSRWEMLFPQRPKGTEPSR